MSYGPGNLSPTLSCAAKLGSIVRHIEEAHDTSTPIDMLTAIQLTRDPEVQEWMSAMDKAALLPVKR